MTPLLFLAFACFTQDPPPPKKQLPVPQFETKVLLERVEQLAREATEKEGVPGLSIAIDKDGEHLLSKGWGWADAKRSSAVDAETRFPIGTLTRQFTAVAVLQLIDAKKLALEDEVSKILPGFNSAAHKVTVQQLLSNTSGVPARAALVEAAKKADAAKDIGELDEAHFLALYAKAPFAFEPGQDFALDNSGWVLLSMIVQKVAGEPYTDYIKKNVIEPAGLEHTGFCPLDTQPLFGYAAKCSTLATDADLEMPKASSDAQAPAGPKPAGDGKPAGDTKPVAAAATKPVPTSTQSLCSTPNDMVKWQHALLERTVFSERASRLIMTPTKLPDGNSTNYGYAIEMSRLGEYKVYSHTGGVGGFRVRMAYYSLPHVTVCVFANCDTAPVEHIEREIARIVLQVPPPEAFDLKIDEAELKRSAAIYQIATTRITIRAKDATLWYESADRDPIRLRYQGEHVYVWDNDPSVRITFHPDGDAAASFQIFRGGFTSVAKRFE